MALFNLALKIVLVHEGGYGDDPDDRGGATNYGITHLTLAKWRKVDSVTPDQVRALTLEEAGEIYRANYWDVVRLDEVTSQLLAENIFDFGVNAGTGTAVRAIQKAVNWVRKDVALAEDGKIGPKTLAAINGESGRALNLKFFQIRMQHYHDICQRRKQNRKFLYAWMKRSLYFVDGKVD